MASADWPEGIWRTIERVVDGDERVRWIGVATPETVHPQKPVGYFGKEASEFTRTMVEGQRVRIEYEEGAPAIDRYGRTLAYVYTKYGGIPLAGSA